LTLFSEVWNVVTAPSGRPSLDLPSLTSLVISDDITPPPLNPVTILLLIPEEHSHV
jgi:hypothetical protein